MGEHIRSLLEYLFLGLLQGITEPIPVSSSGHLVLVQHIFNLKEQGMVFEAFLNFASLIAIAAYYIKDIVRIIKNFFLYIFTRENSAKEDFKIGVFLIIGTIPAGIVGALFNNQIGNLVKNNIHYLALGLFISAIALFAIRKLKGHKSMDQITTLDVILIGIAQAVALFPGISRSGATIVAAMLLGLKKETALRFSFLLYVPVSIGSLVLTVKDLSSSGGAQSSHLNLIIAFIVTLIATYISLKWFIDVMLKGRLIIFSVYCAILGVCIFLFL